MGCHPAAATDGQPPGTHAISFYCDDVAETVAELKGRGVEFVAPITDEGYGLVTYFRMPGEVVVQLYQPLYERRWEQA
jgi:predicted enzyme related to lactoylglutathione lyase